MTIYDEMMAKQRPRLDWAFDFVDEFLGFLECWAWFLGSWLSWHCAVAGGEPEAYYV